MILLVLFHVKGLLLDWVVLCKAAGLVKYVIHLLSDWRLTFPGCSGEPLAFVHTCLILKSRTRFTVGLILLRNKTQCVHVNQEWNLASVVFIWTPNTCVECFGCANLPLFMHSCGHKSALNNESCLLPHSYLAFIIKALECQIKTLN